MATHRPQTPSRAYQSVPTPHDPSHLNRGYGAASHQNVEATDFAAHPTDSSPLSQSMQQQRLGRFEEDFDARTRGSSVLADGDLPQRSASRASNLNQGPTPSRSNTLKKKGSFKRSGSLKRSGSRRSAYAGSIRGVSFEDDEKENMHNSVFYTPVPTSGSPTELLANRFQAWRKLLKDLIVYFREVAASYDHRSKSLLKVSNVINNTNAPSMFLTEGGLNDANRILRDFHKQAIAEASKAKDVETEVINQLNGLRADLSQKIKEIKALSGDFKNSVEKEKETTRKCVAALTEALAVVDTDPAAIAGKGDPYVVRLGVDRQVERQIDEENYLHRAYLNLENSGRELESIVVGEIQRAYNALASILKREADEIYSTVDRLRDGPIGMPRDFEWNQFVLNDSHFVNPSIPLRRLEDIEYPGKHHPATTEVRAGMLERKSKYLKSYTPGWYVLSPTHLHEFKSADRIYTQPPVMSLYLPDQKLGSHSQPGSSSHKFVLKGRQTGSMHRGHTWVFRAETYDTMLAWYEDIKNLTEKKGEERDAFVRRHVRSASQSSARSASTDGALDEDEADQVPYASQQSISNDAARQDPGRRPSPGGRFPSDLQLERNLQAPLPPSSGSSEVGHDLTTASGGLQDHTPYPTQTTNHNATMPHEQYYDQAYPTSPNDAAYQYNNDYAYASTQQYQNDYSNQSQPAQFYNPAPEHGQPAPVMVEPTVMPHEVPMASQPVDQQQPAPARPDQEPGIAPLERHNSTYGDWMAPVAGGAAAGGLAAAAYNQHQQHQEPSTQQPPVDRLTATPVITSAETVPTDMAASGVQGNAVEEIHAPQPIPIAAEKPFLGNDEAVPATASSNVPNGGPVMHETGHTFRPVMRQNTDISVSDLHIPGEYPRIPKSEA